MSPHQDATVKYLWHASLYKIQSLYLTDFTLTFREVPPRFAIPQTFDHELALRWKALDEIERKQKEELENEMRAARRKLMDEMMRALEGMARLNIIGVSPFSLPMATPISLNSEC